MVGMGRYLPSLTRWRPRLARRYRMEVVLVAAYFHSDPGGRLPLFFFFDYSYKVQESSSKRKDF
jgi:hypothetical protein